MARFTLGIRDHHLRIVQVLMLLYTDIIKTRALLT